MILSRIHPFAVASFAFVVAASAAVGCSGSSGDPAAESGDEQDLTAAKCRVFSARTGRTMTKTTLATLKDPVAQILLNSGDTCPASLQDVVAKLRKLDVNGCADTAGQPPAGTKTRLISERSQVLGVPDSYRAVITRACDGRTEHGIFMSVFGIGAADKTLPQDVELIGEDKTRGVYDYYALEGGKWTFFGDSADFINDGYDCTGGTCKTVAAAKTRCAGCHTSGGLVMKELNSPWVHWEGDTNTPGAADMVTKFKDHFGSKADGINLESTVAAGNRDVWIPRKVELLKSKGVAELLRPLFCTTQVNLQASSASSSLSSLRNDFFLDPMFSKFDSVTVSNTDYLEILGKNGQKIVGGDGAQLKNKDGKPVIDTFFAFSYPERAGEDVDYVKALVSKGVIDDDFAKDVLSVDFTRPIFSAERCSLLEHAPTVEAATVGPDTIRDGFVAKLTAAAPKAGTPAATLLASLKNKSDAATHAADVDKFFAACKARPQKELLDDAVQIASMLRNKVRTLQVMEFSESLPVDSLKVSPASLLDPVTCKRIER
jgi:hypothetical protein